jgi:hypothetical protein
VLSSTQSARKEKRLREETIHTSRFFIFNSVSAGLFLIIGPSPENRNWSHSASS